MLNDQKFRFVGCIYLLLVLFLSYVSSCSLRINLSPDAVYSINVGGEQWFKGGETQIYVNGWFSTSSKTLVLSNPPVISSGSDGMGKYNQTMFTFNANGTTFIAIVKDYTTSNDNDPNSCAIVFEQHFPQGANNTQSGSHLSTSINSVSTEFPSLSTMNLQSNQERGYVEYYDQVVGGMVNGTKHGVWNSTTKIAGGSEGGPIFIFNRETQESVVLSPWSNFMVGNIAQSSSHQNYINIGIMGSVSSYPVNYSFSSVIFSGPTLRKTVNSFGYALSYLMNKKQPSSDITEDVLGYSTDNGAFYYYNTDSNTTYQDQMIKLHDYFQTQEIPVAHILLDSWWYFQGSTKGVVNWTARPSIFPDGLQYVYEKTQWPVQGHNRYWDAKTVYAKQNGGDYNFIIEGSYAIPDDQSFWNYLFTEGKKWGLIVYEQDWLHNEWEFLTSTKTDATLSQRWLQQMANAASTTGIKIQYCMAWARFALASVQFPSVNQIRVSDDYEVDLIRKFPAPVNLYVGVSSLLAYSLGLKPSKDVFWTTENQPYVPRYKVNVTGPYPSAHAAVATYTTGPVTFGDGVNYTNKTLIMKSCMINGTLLQPTSPFVAINEYFIYRSFGSGGPAGEVWHSDTFINGFYWHHLISMNLESSYRVSYTIFTQGTDQNHSYLRYDNEFNTIDYFDQNSTFVLEPSQLPKFDLLHLSPIFESGWSLLGEYGKWVPVSSRRINNVTDDGQNIFVYLNGVVGEKISVSLAYVGGDKSIKNYIFTCVFDQDVIYLSSAVIMLSSSQNKFSSNIRQKELSPVSDSCTFKLK